MGLVTNLELRGSKRIAHHPADQQTRGQLRGDMMMRWRMESEETQDVSDEYETFPVDRNTPSRVKWMVGRWMEPHSDWATTANRIAHYDNNFLSIGVKRVTI